MDFIMLPLLLISAIAFVLSLGFIIQTLKQRLFPNHHLPPGSLGWPLIGETLDFLRDGNPDMFVAERMEKYDSRVFKTSLVGYNSIVLCGTAGHKFLCTNENNLVNVWWPESIRTLFKSSLLNVVAGDEAKWMRKMLLTFLNPDALKRYTQRMDMVAQQHMKMHWEGKEEVIVHEVVKKYIFELACNLFTSIDDPGHLSKLDALFTVFTKGVFGFAINLPGTTFYKAVKAANAIKEDIKLIVRERREALDKNLVSPTQDLLSYLLVTSDTSGRFLSEMEIVDNILTLLFAGDTSRSVITLVMKYLAELPQVYEKVLKEQIEIANSKEPGQMLQWEDVQKMTYSWAVVSEVMRLSPPSSVAFREALVDFTYEGYTIPKGWKLIMSTGSTHRDPTLFPNPKDFDASRFEGTGPTPYSYVPFGGGPRMCLGHQFARLEILVFLHNVVKRFKWDSLIPNDKFKLDPTLTPVHGLPIHLHPRQSYGPS